MKKRTSFISNSSSCSFIVTTAATPEQTDDILKKIISFHNGMKGDNILFEEMFNKSFKASKSFAKNYDPSLMDWTLKSVDTSEGKTIIYPKIEDNEFPVSFISLVSEYTDSDYIREDNGIGAWL